MKRYLVFAGDNYYPSGGWDDHIGSLDNLDDLPAMLGEWNKNPSGYDWWHVVDSNTGQVVKNSG